MLEQVKEKLSQSEELWRVLESSGLISNVDVQMIRSAERTGTIDTGLSRIADKYHKRFEEEIEKRINSIEPVFVLILSAVIGVVTLMVLIPLAQVLAGAV